MQVSYNIYEMIHGLKFGIWQGGEIDQLGYVGMVKDKQHYSTLEHNRCMSISHDTFIDTTKKTAMTLKICIYHPYNHEYIEYHLPTEISFVDFINNLNTLGK